MKLEECIVVGGKFLGIENLTPNTHNNAINIKIFKYKKKLPE